MTLNEVDLEKYVAMSIKNNIGTYNYDLSTLKKNVQLYINTFRVII